VSPRLAPQAPLSSAEPLPRPPRPAGAAGTAGEDEGKASWGVLERELATLFTAILERSVGLADNLFLLGVDSLRATQILVQVEERYGVGLSLQDLMQAPTVRGLAAAIRVAQAAAGGEEVLAELAALSDEEAERMLAERAGERR
jgi:acyl carrier protein